MLFRSIDTELQLKDLETIENRLAKTQKQAVVGGDKQAKRAVEILLQYKAVLEQGLSARTVELETFTAFDRTCYLFTATEQLDESLDVLLGMVGRPYFTVRATIRYGTPSKQVRRMPEPVAFTPISRRMVSLRCIASSLTAADRKSTRLNSSHVKRSRMPSSA